jgi:peptidoglycan lytic transglycosylase
MHRVRIFFLACLLILAAGGASADPLSPDDRAAYRAAFAAARAGDWAAAGLAADRAQERLPAKVLRWLELQRDRQAGFAEIVAFADANPDWPLISVLRQRAEEAADDVPDAVLLPYFRKNRPTTPDGKLRFAAMLAASGQREGALAVVRGLWVGPELGPDQERAILANYAEGLRPEDHIARLQRLLWDGQESAARRQEERVPEEWRRLADARLALAKAAPDADALAARVPMPLREDAGLLLDLARWYRKRDRLDDAVGVLRHPPAELVRPSAWWSERRYLAQKLLEDHRDLPAYTLISAHAQGDSGADAADAEFLAGWIALRRLGEARPAYEHFTHLFGNVKAPISLSRGAYWAGRAAEALGQPEDAKHWFGEAAQHPTTYYGQLAAAKLGRIAPPAFAPEPQPRPEDRAAVERRETARAAQMLAELGEGETARPFLLRLDAAAKTPVEHKAVADFAARLGRFDVAVTAAKRALAEGVLLLERAYPLIPVDAAGPVEAPLVLAITRQESSFDPGAVSRSDARGLMQLKPSTAKDVAKALSIPFAADKLTSEPRYNLTLGRAYLGKMIDGFSGSYVLAVAAYNAGPNRVKQWLGTYGDPRAPGVDVVDWVETIPFGETRNYVQRVLENLQVYRLRLGDTARAFTLASDLRR